MSNQLTELTGLRATNPFEFFAALGAQAAFDLESQSPTLKWSDSTTPIPLFPYKFTYDRIAEQCIKVLQHWRLSKNLTPMSDDGKPLAGGEDLKFSEADLKTFLKSANQDQYCGKFLMSLVAEGSIVKKGDHYVSKPSDLVFTSGRQHFLQIVKRIINEVNQDDIESALQFGERKEVKYNQPKNTLMWDIENDPVYALSGRDPGRDSKWICLGMEALAILGIGRFPSFGSKGRTSTLGFSGTWKSGRFDWPIWDQPASGISITPLLGATTPFKKSLTTYYPGWSITRIYSSEVTRSDPGGFGRFKPPDIVWQQSESREEREKIRRDQFMREIKELAQEAEKNGLTPEILDRILREDD